MPAGSTSKSRRRAAPLGNPSKNRPLHSPKSRRPEKERFTLQQERLLDALPDGLCGLDCDGRIRFANPAAALLLGASVENLLGKDAHDLLHGEEAGKHKSGASGSLFHLEQLRTPLSGEETFYRCDGGCFLADYTLAPILDGKVFSGAVLSFRDNSGRQARERVKDEFISTVSHELRTPLTSIRGALGLLSSGILGPINDKAANLLRIALTNSDRLVRLINDILDLERIQSGREPFTFCNVCLSDLVSQAIEGIQPVADNAFVRIKHKESKVEIAADSDRIMQVVTNLLSNAVKFSPPKSQITVSIQPGVTGATLSVTDQGRGVPTDKLETIFGRFQQVDATDSRQKGGTGLGLAICRTIVLHHSGRIWAEQNPGQGATFRVFLPYQPSVASAPENDGEALQCGAVLLADANGASRPLVAGQLARHGYRVLETETSEQTLAAAHTGVDAILLDASLDGMSGWKLLPQLRRTHPEDCTPVILLCGSSQNEKAARVKADGRVVKPPQEQELLRELARVLSTPGEKARLLIVEDDVDLAEMIGGLFASDAIEVKLAHSSKAAMKACRAFQPNLLVLDIGLPDGDGFHLVDWLRQQKPQAGLPLVVYSGRELSATERRQLTLGPTHFLNKARVQPQQLEALVLTMLRSAKRPAKENPPQAARER